MNLFDLVDFFSGNVLVHRSDVPFLELVARPICFNPSSKLYRHAKRNKWNVVVERKDVIYEL